MAGKIPKLIVTDWDGTFAEQGSVPRAEAIEAKNKLITKGSHVVLVSGRSTKEVLKYIKEYKLSSDFIAELGTVVYFKGKEYINHGNLQNLNNSHLSENFIKLLDEGTNAHDAMFQIGIVDKILTKAKKLDMPLKIFTPKDGRPGEDDNNIMHKKGTVLLRGKIEVDDINKFLEKNAAFLECKDNGLTEDNFGDHSYHLIIKGANKESAVKLLQNLMKIEKEETIALGDSLSDMTLVIVVNHFYLMKNGLDHTPDMFERFKKQMEKHFSSEEIEQIIKKITVTDNPASLGWTEVVNNFI